MRARRLPSKVLSPTELRGLAESSTVNWRWRQLPAIAGIGAGSQSQVASTAVATRLVEPARGKGGAHPASRNRRQDHDLAFWHRRPASSVVDEQGRTSPLAALEQLGLALRTRKPFFMSRPGHHLRERDRV